MENKHLSEFAAKVRHKRRISFGDVRRLKRDILPDGIGSREEAEDLLSMGCEVTKADPAWERWLVMAMVDFVVWAERPTGVVDEETALWLQKALMGNGNAGTSRGARRIAREIAKEAHAFENDAFAALLDIVDAPAARSPECRLELESAVAQG